MSSEHDSGIFKAQNCIDGHVQLKDSFCHTGSSKPAPWLALKLKEAWPVHSVIIYNRADCCGNRTKNVEIRLIDDLNSVTDDSMHTGGLVLDGFQGPGTNGQVIHRIVPTGSTTAWPKYVLVQMDHQASPSNERILNLQEVKVVGLPLLPIVGASLSSQHHEHNFGALKCIDGIEKHVYNSMCHTDDYSAAFNPHNPRRSAPWLKLDLQEEWEVQSVIIYNRGDCCGHRTRNVEVRVVDDFTDDLTEDSMYTGASCWAGSPGPRPTGRSYVSLEQNRPEGGLSSSKWINMQKPDMTGS